MERNLKIGDHIILTSDLNMFNSTYKKGHIFKIYGDAGHRGWNIIDDAGNMIDECLFIHHQFKCIDIKEIRLRKLNKINSNL